MQRRTRCARRLGPALLAALSWLLGACGGVPDDAELQAWAATERGLQRLAGVVAEPALPMATRTRALEVAALGGHELRVSGMLALVAEPTDREALARALLDALLRPIEGRTPLAVPAKDAALSLGAHLPPDALDRMQRAVATWAFSDLSWDMPGAELKAKLEGRLDPDQIAALGPHGLEGAAILLANGVSVDTMTRTLTSAASPAANALLIKAMGRFVPTFRSVTPLHLDALRKTRDPAAAALLFSLYRDHDLDQKTRDACFSVAALMLDQPTVKARSEAIAPIVDELLAIGRAPVREDRWLAAANIIAVGAATRLPETLSLFVDDDAYGADPDRTGNAMLDLCFALHALGAPEATAPPLERAFADGGRVQRALAIVCAKTLGLERLRPHLEALAARVDTREDVQIADLLGDLQLTDKKKVPLTLGLLARNALQGLDLLAASHLSSLPEDQRKARHFVIAVELRELGERYARLVEERYRDSLAKP